MTKSDKNQLLYFERKVLKKIYGPIRNSVKGEYEKRKNAKLEELFDKPSTKNMLYVESLKWARHMWRADGIIIKNVMIGTLSVK